VFCSLLPTQVAQQLLRTWANGWTTSYRMHESELLNCIFGCVGEKDCLQYYLFRPALWLSIESAFGLKVSLFVSRGDFLANSGFGSSCCNFVFLRHLCLCDCSFLLAARVAIASLLYHACKNAHLPFLRRLAFAGEIERLQLFVCALAAALVVKISSLPGVGPREAWSKPFFHCTCFPSHVPLSFFS